MMTLTQLSRRGTPFLASLARLGPNVQIREKSDFSVYDAFRRGLKLPGLTTGKTPTGATGEGGAYTKATTPPKLWAPLIDFGDSVAAAYEFVESQKRQLQDVSAIETAGLTIIDDKSSEQDITKLFNLFVMYPVEVALLQLPIPESYTLHMRCEVHPGEGRAVRVDIVLEARSPRTVKTIAVMEMKNHGVLKAELKNIALAQVASEYEAEKLARESDVRFEDDSRLLLRQCAAYASRFKTRHVAMCDWTSAIYLDFAKLPEALKTKQNKGGFAGNYVLMYEQSDEATFHYALLAFFKNAVEEWVQEVKADC